MTNQTLTLQTTDHYKVRMGSVGTKIIWLVKRDGKWTTVTEETGR
jgi:hypothetical protein